MVDTNRLRGIIAERNTSQSKVAKAIGIASDTFYKKMKKGKFDTDEAEKMIKLLSIENPASIFFAEIGAHDAPGTHPIDQPTRETA